MVFKEQFETLRRHLMKTVLKFPNFALRRREEEKKKHLRLDMISHCFCLFCGVIDGKGFGKLHICQFSHLKRRGIFEGMMIGELFFFFFFPGYAFAFYFFKLKSLLSVFLLTFNVNVKGGWC